MPCNNAEIILWNGIFLKREIGHPVKTLKQTIVQCILSSLWSIKLSFSRPSRIRKTQTYVTPGGMKLYLSVYKPAWNLLQVLYKNLLILWITDLSGTADTAHPYMHSSLRLTQTTKSHFHNTYQWARKTKQTLPSTEEVLYHNKKH